MIDRRTSKHARIDVSRPAAGSRLWWYAVLGLAAVAAGVRLIGLGTHPGWEWDEPVYTAIATSVSQGHGIHLFPELGDATEPYLYHPPPYFLTLGAWFKVFGASIFAARLFAVFTSVLVTIVAAVAVRRLVNPRAGVIAAGLLGLDSWLMYENRISWLDNSMMFWFSLVMLALSFALKADDDRLWAMVGLAIGATAVWKHMGIAVMPGTVLAIWMFRHHQARPIRNLINVGASAAAAIAVYLLTMTLVFPDDYWRQNAAQWVRSSGQKSANGSISLGSDVWLQALVDTYWVFTASILLVVGVSFLGLWRFLRVRRTGPLSDDMVFWCVGAGSAFFLAVLALKFPHYLIMVWVPMLCFAATVVDRALDKWRRAVAALLVVLVVANLVGAGFRFYGRSDHALATTATYLGEKLEPSDRLIADEPVAAALRRSSCRGSSITLCGEGWTWIVTYTSQTQSLPTEPKFLDALATATECVAFSGFKETITIYARDAADCTAP